MTTAAPPFDAAALVRTLSDEAKEAVFAELVRVAFEVGPEPIVLSALGLVVRIEADPLGPTITIREMLDQLAAEDARRSP